MPRRSVLLPILACVISLPVNAATALPQPSNAEAAPPPSSRLGTRAAIVKAGLPVVRQLVIVEDDASYVDAIGRWGLEARYPVLIDDGSDDARDAIARFVRAFEPERVVRWRTEAKLPGPEAERQTLIEEAALAAWNTDRESYRERWEEIGFVPPGVVGADANDPAWTAALAIAAGRGLPIAWVEAPGSVNESMSRTDLDRLEDAITARCDELGLSWRGLGDDIDAIVLCANAPVRVKLPTEGHGALTDALGRVGRFGESTGNASPPRWAWAGQIFGGKAEAAYRAMCGLFLVPRSSWLFDGYENKAGFTDYDMTPAAELLNKVGLETVLDDLPRSGLRHWRARASAPIPHQLVLVNTKGNRSWFDLNPGRGVNSDAPILGVPAWVHFTHSWSAVTPAAKHTIAGTWFDRGAYAYVGSVEEPYLQAFVPPSALVARMIGGSMPIAAAARPDGASRIWRIATLCDPLLTLTRTGPDSESELPLEGVEPLDASMSAALKSGDYPDAVRQLVMLGRTADAVRLGNALTKDDTKVVDPETAAELAPAAFHEGAFDLLIACASRLPPKRCQERGVTDLLWLGVSPRLGIRPPKGSLTVMGDRLRRASIGRDAKEIADALEKVHGSAARGAFIRKAIANAPSDEAKQELLKSVGG